jgi:phosphoribosylformylglycinamidine synthase
MISCLGNMPDVGKALSKHLRQAQSKLVLVGERKNECGGGSYYELHNELGAKLPRPRLDQIGQELRAIYELIQQELVLSAHDVSKGGLAIALAKMSFKNRIGFKVTLPPGSLASNIKLFSESGGFILEVDPAKLRQLEEILDQKQLPYTILGQTQTQPRLQIENCLDLSLDEAHLAFENGLREKLL